MYDVGRAVRALRGPPSYTILYIYVPHKKKQETSM